MITYTASKPLQMVLFFGLVLVTPAPLRGVTFNLLPPDDTINKMTIEVILGELPDSDTSRVDGSLEADLGLQIVGSELVVTELTLEGGPLDFIDDVEFDYVFLSIVGTDLAGTVTTTTPPSTVDPDTGSFDAGKQLLTINQGLFVNSADPNNPRNLADDPFSSLSKGTGTVAIQEIGVGANQVFFRATLTLPIDLEGLVAEQPIPVNMKVDGIIQAISEFTLFDADFDLDLDVDGHDFLAWQRGNGTMGTAVRPDGDANSDTNVNALDLDIWQGQFGVPATVSTSTVATIPEPGTLVLVLMMGSLLVLPRRSIH